MCNAMLSPMKLHMILWPGLILKPNSCIVFEPFNPSNEDCKSPDFQNVMLISDEKGHLVMRIHDSSKWESHKALKAVGHEKGSIGSCGCRHANFALQDEGCLVYQIEDRENDSSDDDKYDNGNDSEAQPVCSKCGSIKQHISRRNSDRRASKIKGKELKAHSQKGQSTDETEEEAVSKAKAKGHYNLHTDDSGEEEEGDEDEDNEDEEVKAVVGIRKPLPKKAIQPVKDHRAKGKWPTDKSTTHHEMEHKQVHNEWKKVGSSHELPQALPSPKVNSQAHEVEKV
ncbi:hypothetical protein BS47DRAFT_1369974 [Hydnum rufescens UP504]|uniref:Uncharacterized protein n=1 Tax=Hydnum rufescens UP504 TaxID=1448309 RepID=A0A9P6DLT4_9AGAM|nr:hypothetical protein BS47DRAFT_1369974 [Hydnum rufescens UP504]